MKKHYWTTKYGDKIAVANMTSDHLRNTVNCILDGRITGRYQNRHVNNWIQILESELNKRENKLINNNKLYQIY